MAKERLSTVNTKAGGLVDFDFDRDSASLRCALNWGRGRIFASAAADTKGPGPEGLMAESDLPDGLNDHYRFFKVPPKWSLVETDGLCRRRPFSPTNFFRTLDDSAVSVGTAGSPVQMVLDPHWQYLRLTYFDRALKNPMSILPRSWRDSAVLPARGSRHTFELDHSTG